MWDLLALLLVCLILSLSLSFVSLTASHYYFSVRSFSTAIHAGRYPPRRLALECRLRSQAQLPVRMGSGGVNRCMHRFFDGVISDSLIFFI